MEPLGFIHDKLDIKILILFILGRFEEPAVPLEIVTELALCDKGVGYFEFSECLKELEDSEHITQSDVDGLVFITPKGRKNGTTTENSLPYSVRKSTEEAIAKVKKARKRGASIHTELRKKEEGGYTLTCKLNDGLGEVLDLTVFVATQEQGEEMAARFRKQAEEIHGNIIRLLTEEKP